MIKIYHQKWSMKECSIAKFGRVIFEKFLDNIGMVKIGLILKKIQPLEVNLFFKRKRFSKTWV